MKQLNTLFIFSLISNIGIATLIYAASSKLVEENNLEVEEAPWSYFGGTRENVVLVTETIAA
jgi:hypothetical protein